MVSGSNLHKIMAFLASKISIYGSGVKLSLNSLYVKAFDEFSIRECHCSLYWSLSACFTDEINQSPLIKVYVVQK